jgi:hypothetical protein
MYVCMYVCVCMYSYQPEGWLNPHTMLAPDAHTHTHMHTQAHTHKYTYSTPHNKKKLYARLRYSRR